MVSTSRIYFPGARSLGTFFFHAPRTTASFFGTSPYPNVRMEDSEAVENNLR